MGAQGLVTGGNIGKELYFGANLRLVREELDLLESHYVGKLDYNFLGIFAKFAALPSP